MCDVLDTPLGLSLGLMPQTSLSDHADRRRPLAQNAVSGAHAPDFVERTARPGAPVRRGSLSLGLMPQTSLSELDVGLLCQIVAPVSGAHAPDFVERCSTTDNSTRGQAAVSGAHAPDFVERTWANHDAPSLTSVSGAHAPDFVERQHNVTNQRLPKTCLWGSCPRLR